MSQKPSEEGALGRRVSPEPNAKRSQMPIGFEHKDTQDSLTGAVNKEAEFWGMGAGCK